MFGGQMPIFGGGGMQPSPQNPMEQLKALLAQLTAGGGGLQGGGMQGGGTQVPVDISHGFRMPPTPFTPHNGGGMQGGMPWTPHQQQVHGAYGMASSLANWIAQQRGGQGLQ